MLSTVAVLLALFSQAGPADSPKLLKGYPVQVTGVSDRDHSPAGPISLCLDIPPQPACHVTPKDYSYNPNVQLIQLTIGEPAILFSSENYGMSGWGVRFALLRLNQKNRLEDLLPRDIIVSNQSQHAIWDEKVVSNSKIFVTANCLWGPDEGHFGQHRYLISTYRRKESAYPADTDDSYYLHDQYMTVRKYELEANPQPDILAAERPEIVARLARIKEAETKPE